MSEPLLLSRRLAPSSASGTQAAESPGAAEPRLVAPAGGGPPGEQQAPTASEVGRDSGEAAPLLVLSLSASERQRLRGHCRSLCGRDLLLQLPRGEGPLQPQERLAGDDGLARVRVEAAPEALLVARSEDPFTLLRAAYHLGNRHVALELRPGELRLLQDPVLEALLRGLGVAVASLTAPFQPESGAYSAGGHGHHHSQGHDSRHTPNHDHNDDHSHPHSHSHSHSHSHGAGSAQHAHTPAA